MMRLDSNDTVAAHNAEYETVHTVAYGISAEEQNDEQILRAYANKLCNYAATKLNTKIIRRGSRIKTLKDAMEEAEILDSQSRQEEISKIERDSIRDTTVIDPINDISLTDESVNFMQTRRGDGKFNSTMKNYSPGNKQGNYSNYNNSDISVKTGAHNGTSSTDADSRGISTSPDGLNVTSSSNTMQKTRT